MEAHTISVSALLSFIEWRPVLGVAAMMLTAGLIEEAYHRLFPLPVALEPAAALQD